MKKFCEACGVEHDISEPIGRGKRPYVFATADARAAHDAEIKRAQNRRYYENKARKLGKENPPVRERPTPRAKTGSSSYGVDLRSERACL